MARRTRKDITHIVNGKRVTVSRLLFPEHISANYHLQEWGDVSRPEHPLHGEYDTSIGKVTILHVDGSDSPTDAPEFLVTFEDGSAVTTLDAETAEAYLGGNR